MSALSEWIDQADADQLRAALHRIAELINVPERSTPPNESLVVVGTSGGHPQRPYREEVFYREDEPNVDREVIWQRAGGDWFKVDSGDDHQYTWGELNLLDDPPCDRPTVTIDGHFLHTSTLVKAIIGEIPHGVSGTSSTASGTARA
jgi:hypothetical protein